MPAHGQFNARCFCCIGSRLPGIDEGNVTDGQFGAIGHGDPKGVDAITGGMDAAFPAVLYHQVVINKKRPTKQPIWKVIRQLGATHILKFRCRTCQLAFKPDIVVAHCPERVLPGKIIQELYKKTSLQSTFGAILIALDSGQPKQFNLIELLERFKDHRLDVIQRRSSHDLEKAEAEKHIVEGLIAALDAIEEVIAIIRGSVDRQEALHGLEELLGLSAIQADAILNMRLAKLTSLEQKSLKTRLRKLKGIIKELKGIIRSEARKLEIIHEELEGIVQEYGDERRTVITEGGESEDYLIEEKVADEEVAVTYTEQAFVKRIPMRLYKRRTRNLLANAKEVTVRALNNGIKESK
mgnify:CR=1 FL=1